MADHPFTVASANAAGAARAIAFGRGPTTGTLADFVLDPAGDESARPVVAALQEVFVAEPDDTPAELRRSVEKAGRRGEVDYHASVTSCSYPLDRKWRGRWDKGGPALIEQGMATAVHGDIEIVDPYRVSPSEGAGTPFRRLVIDLPVLNVAGQTATSSLWTYYQGDRNTEPRVATAHRVGLGDPPWAPEAPQFILVNAHVGTLSEEDHEPAKGELARTVRARTAAGVLVRRAQLGVVADFVREVAYRDLGLPVVIAGDFNATPDAAEIVEFMRSSSLKAVFETGPSRCWRCRTALGERKETLYSSVTEKAVLTRTEDQFLEITGGGAHIVQGIGVAEWCTTCELPQFTHKRNFGLIDNIFFTDPAQKAWKLAFRLTPDESRRGLRLDSYFSDHLPIWSGFSASAVFDE